MKAITLHQPWASLVALGVKTVETRSWSTSYRGPLAIHAGKKRMPLMHLPKLWTIGKTREEQRDANGLTWLFCNTITAPEHQRPHRQGEKVPAWATTPTLFRPARGTHGQHWDETLGTSAVEQGSAILLPLGAIVATCTLADVVPIVDLHDCPDGPFVYCDGDWLQIHDGPDDAAPRYSETEQLYGDYRPDRYAWLLADVQPTPARCPGCSGTGRIQPYPAYETTCWACNGVGHCEPVQARGKQGLWEWTP